MTSHASAWLGLLVLGFLPCLAQDGGLPTTEELLRRFERLEAELDDLRRQLAERAAEELAAKDRVAAAPANEAEPPESASPDSGAVRPAVSILVDGFYSLNFNRPDDGFNALRAYDTLDRSLGLNQAAVVLETPVDPANGRRLGARVDLMVGQATQTLQGNPGQEPRPELYRPLFQAYGSYVAPIGSGLRVDFGKWASSLGLEGNYTQDQVNYSRSLLFNFLPFYHFGARARYDFGDRWGTSYWLTNGDGQTENFNRSLSQAAFLHWRPHRRVETNWSYFGGAGNATRRSAPGGPIVGEELDGKFHVAYAQALWRPTPRLKLGAEATEVVHRLRSNSSPSTTLGAGAVTEFAFAPRWAVGARFEAVADRAGFYSGIGQTLREGTLTLSRRLSEAMLLRYEVRQDRSNRPFFPTDDPNRLARRQTTMLVGVTFWTPGPRGGW